jgi:hypothetical protein
MRRPATVHSLAAAAAVGLAACSTPPASREADQQAAAKPDPGCQVRSHGGMSRPGDNVPINMHVQNTGRWCFSGFGFSGTSAAGSRVVETASHGEVRLLVREGGIVFGYRPKPNYTGPDDFLISMPSGTG